MASTQEFQKINLSSDDVPGAYINIDDFESSSIVQLKRWVECRGLKATGNKPDLLQRWIILNEKYIVFLIFFYIIFVFKMIIKCILLL